MNDDDSLRLQTTVVDKRPPMNWCWLSTTATETMALQKAKWKGEGACDEIQNDGTRSENAGKIAGKTKKKETPNMGLEPTTTRLKAGRSSNWANSVALAAVVDSCNMILSFPRETTPRSSLSHPNDVIEVWYRSNIAITYIPTLVSMLYNEVFYLFSLYS